MSAAANPAGRNAIERFVGQPTETDASALGDSCNACSLDQPVLYEFLQEFRSLLAERFAARAARLWRGRTLSEAAPLLAIHAQTNRQLPARRDVSAP